MLRCEAVDRLSALIATGAFRVQLHEAKLALALSGPGPTATATNTGCPRNSPGCPRNSKDHARCARLIPTTYPCTARSLQADARECEGV